MKLLSFLLVGVTVAAIGATPAVSSAKIYHSNTQSNLVATGTWKFVGGAQVENDRVRLTERSGEDEMAYRDVDVSKRQGEYVVFAAYTKAEDVTGGNITGLPVLYGMALGANGKVISYFQGQDMMVQSAKDGKWTVSSGLFKIPSGTKTIRYVLQQAEKKGSYKDGDDAIFHKAGLFVVSSKTKATEIINNYKNSLNLVK